MSDVIRLPQALYFRADDPAVLTDREQKFDDTGFSADSPCNDRAQNLIVIQDAVDFESVLFAGGRSSQVACDFGALSAQDQGLFAHIGGCREELSAVVLGLSPGAEADGRFLMMYEIPWPGMRRRYPDRCDGARQRDVDVRRAEGQPEQRDADFDPSDQ